MRYAIPLLLLVIAGSAFGQEMVRVSSGGYDVTDAITTVGLAAATVTAGPMFRAINKASRVAAHGFSPKVIWSVVTTACSQCGLPGVAPHDLRRTCARLCHDAGGEIEQIQYLLGHESVQTTDRYIGGKQRLRDALNNRIGLEA